VQWAEPQAGSLFAAIAHDTRLPSAKRRARPPVATAEAVAAVNAAHVDVTVLTGGARPGLATKTAASLTSLGFHVVSAPGNAALQNATSSVVEYSVRSDRPAARTLARLIRNATLRRDPALAAGNIQLILGSAFTALTPAGATRSPGTTDLARRYGGITGNVSICNDAGAFSGPDGDS
jgi:hypothetical protein